MAWPIFGTSNQMLASLTLLALSAWLIRSGRRAFYTIIPMVFMFVTTMVALVLQTLPFVTSLGPVFRGQVKTEVVISGVCGLILLVLGAVAAVSAARALLASPARQIADAAS